jgi:hypothetical protein
MIHARRDAIDPAMPPLRCVSSAMTGNGDPAPARDVEMFRYCRGEQVRVYRLRVVPAGTELWRITETPGQPPSAIKEDDFQDPDVAAQFLKEVERALTAGGWRLVSEFRL